VYLNGQKVFEQVGNPEELWVKPFHFDIGNRLKPGKNVLAVRVHNAAGPGGIWRGVKIFAPK
jgi:hypothetical protein